MEFKINEQGLKISIIAIQTTKIMIKNIYNCKTHNNNIHWLKVIKKKKNQYETHINTKFGVNPNFSPRLNSMYFFHCFFRNITPLLTKHGYWCCVFFILWITLLCCACLFYTWWKFLNRFEGFGDVVQRFIEFQYHSVWHASHF